MIRFFKWFFGLLFLLTAILGGLIFILNWYPADLEEELIMRKGAAPVLKAGQKIKVLSWNIQYLAGKDYVFFYDVEGEYGASLKNLATQPSAQATQKTLLEVARVINEENPDLILLQEVDEGATRTKGQDQLQALLNLISGDYLEHSSSFYWKSSFVPDPNVWGSSGMKLSIISKYAIQKSMRHALPLIRYENRPINRAIYDWIKRQFYLKRCVQEVLLPVEGGKALSVFNTHLSAFAQNSKTMEKQVDKVEALLAKKELESSPWLMGGDFNLLATQEAWQALGSEQQEGYSEKSELEDLIQKYPSIPSPAEVNGKNKSDWFTHFPNDPRVEAPDRVIDYIFISPQIELGAHKVRQGDTWKISDHLPLVLEITIPSN